MSVAVERLETENIIVVSYTAPFKGEDVITANENVGVLKQQIKGDIYRIADLSGISIPWVELLTALQGSNPTQRRDAA